MAIDRQFVFNKVNFFLKKENKFFTSSEIHSIIGIEAFKRVAEDIDFPRTNYSSYVSSGAWQVSAPSDFLKIDPNFQAVYVYNGGSADLDPKDPISIGRANILTATPGVPENYFMENESTIGLYPPSTSGLVVIPYVSEPTSLSSDTDTNELTRECYMAATYWTISQCFSKDNDEERASKYTVLYDKEIGRLRRRYNERFEVPKDLTPSENYTR